MAYVSNEDKQLSIYKRYWVYSPTEAKRINSVANGVTAAKATLGTVVTTGGVTKNYTSIVNDPKKITQSDAIIVMSGDIRKVYYTNPTMG